MQLATVFVTVGQTLFASVQQAALSYPPPQEEAIRIQLFPTAGASFDCLCTGTGANTGKLPYHFVLQLQYIKKYCLLQRKWNNGRRNFVSSSI